MSPTLLPFLFALAAGPGQESVPTWVPTTVLEARSEGGASMEWEGGTAVRARGENPDKDVHEVVIQCSLETITGLRLEALPDSDLKGKGPGRSGSGNFVLSELEIGAASAAGQRVFRRQALTRATAGFVQDGYSAAATIDENPDSGWAVAPRYGQSHALVIEFEKPVANRGGSTFSVRLSFQYGSSHVIGHYRVLATDTAAPLFAEPGPKEQPWSAIQQQINQAIDKGATWLLDTQERDGSWKAHRAGYPTGQTALCLYTLLKSGIPPHHPAVQRAAAFVRARRPIKTYENACQILALSALADPTDQGRVQELVDLMVSWQRTDGGYAYPDGGVDLSNTQYAAFSLNMAAEKGFKVPRDVWLGLGRWTLTVQEETRSPYAPAGFKYRPAAKARGSMTAAGVGVLAICQNQLGRGATPFKGPFQRGLAWLVRHYTVTSNAASEGKHDASNLYYYLYGLERVGGLAALERLGHQDWYRDGARHLVRKQGGNGSWTSNNQTDTCFALLFLGKATKAVTGAFERGPATYGTDDPEQEVNLRAAGDSPMTIWVSSFGTTIREVLLPDAEPGASMPVESVRFLVAPAEGGETVLLQEVTVEVDSGSRQRLAIQHQFPANGRYRLSAEVDVQDPDDPLSLHTLASAPLEVQVREVMDPEILSYADDVTRNLLAGTAVEAKASSEFSGDWSADRVLDNYLVSGWLSKDGDYLPTLRLVFERPLRANTLLLSHAAPEDKERSSRIQVLRVQLNGKGDTYDLTMVAEDAKKTVWALPKTMVLRRLDLAVIEASAGHPTKNAVGLAEVELQLRKPSK